MRSLWLRMAGANKSLTIFKSVIGASWLLAPIFARSSGAFCAIKPAA